MHVRIYLIYIFWCNRKSFLHGTICIYSSHGGVRALSSAACDWMAYDFEHVMCLTVDFVVFFSYAVFFPYPVNMPTVMSKGYETQAKEPGDDGRGREVSYSCIQIFKLLKTKT